MDLNNNKIYGVLTQCRRSILLTIMLLASIAWQGCTISYKFNGAALDYNVYKTISVGEFPIRAALVYPPLQQTLLLSCRIISLAIPDYALLTVPRI